MSDFNLHALALTVVREQRADGVSWEKR